jgi:hypothetical protein
MGHGDYENEPKTLKLAVVDTALGKIETSVENEGAMLWHVPPPVSNIAAAPDGSRSLFSKGAPVVQAPTTTRSCRSTHEPGDS